MAYNASLGYDPDKDYSLAIRNATSDTEIKQLQAERQNKIDDIYGGKDPYTTPTVNKVTGNATTPPNTASKYGSDWKPQTATAADSQAYRELQETVNNAGGMMTQVPEVPVVPEVSVPTVNIPTVSTGAAQNTELPGYTDMTEYLKELYEQNLQAELSALEGAYNENVTALEAQQGEIERAYQAARNQQAAQNERERMRSHEYANASGLNTGTAGQGALAQSAAYQSEIANIGSQEAASMADNALALAQLLSQYNGQVQQSKAENSADLAQALYNELLRQQEWDYDQAIYQNEQATANREEAYDRALTMLSYGVMPDEASLAAAGMSGTEAAVILQAALAEAAEGSGSAGKTSGSSATGSGKKTTSGYNNGSLTTEQVKQLQNYFGTTADGMWGANSTNAAGGLTADEAWAQMSGRINGDYISLLDELSRVEDSGRNVNSRAAAVIQKAYEGGKITEAQAEELLAQYGL